MYSCKVMEALRHTSGSGWGDDLLGGLLVAQPIRGSESTMLSSTGSTSGGLEPGKATPLPPRIISLLQSISSSEPGDPGPLSFDNRCIVNIAKICLPAPPPPSPAREISSRKPRYLITASPSAILEKSKTLAKGSLEHHNKNKKIKFELLDIMPVIIMIESCRLYTHMNFTAKASKEGSKEQTFFAELHNCTKRHAPSGFLVICCEPLDSDTTVGHNGFQLDGGPAVRKNMDFTRCFACNTFMLHPKGHKYIAGHRNVSYIYNNTC